MDENRFDELNSMINGIARKASRKLYSRSYDDIVQDLWVKVLETEKRKGQEIDLRLAGRICWDYVNDMIDYDQRRNHYTTDFSGTGDETTEFDDTDFLGLSKDRGNYTSDIMVKDLYDRFPVGSKERIFLDFWGNESGAMPNSRVVPPVTRQNDGYSEKYLAKRLGFTSSTNRSYKNFRDKMKQIIADYFDLK